MISKVLLHPYKKANDQSSSILQKRTDDSYMIIHQKNRAPATSMHTNTYTSNSTKPTHVSWQPDDIEKVGDTPGYNTLAGDSSIPAKAGLLGDESGRSVLLSMRRKTRHQVKLYPSATLRESRPTCPREGQGKPIACMNLAAGTQHRSVKYYYFMCKGKKRASGQISSQRTLRVYRFIVNRLWRN
jgi:hypothetical protein